MGELCPEWWVFTFQPLLPLPHKTGAPSPERCVTDVCEEVIVGQEKNSLLQERRKKGVC